METISKEREKEFITRLRSVAVLLIVTTHSVPLAESCAGTLRIIVEAMHSFSVFGVWFFFLMGGYLFAYEKRGPRDLIVRKSKTLMLPWLVTGSAVYVYTYIRKGGLSLSGWLLFLAGYGNYLWYMVVFVVLIMLYMFLRGHSYAVFLPVVCGLILTIPGILPLIAGADYALWYYLVGAWLIAFGLGFIVNSNHLQPRLQMIVVKWGWCCAALFALVWAALFLAGGQIYYWNIRYLPLSVLSVPAFMWAVTKLEKQMGRFMDSLGRRSFAVYLLHMPIAGIAVNVFSRFGNGYFVLGAPVIVLFVTYTGVRLIELISKKTGWKWLSAVVGLRV